MRMRRRIALDPERKSLDFAFSQDPITLTPGPLSIRLINPTGEGVGPDERIGRQALTLSFQIMFRVEIGPGATNAQVVKFWLLHTKQPQGTILAVNDFLSDPAAPTVSPRSLENIGQHRVLLSRTLRVDPDNFIRTGRVFKHLRIKSRWNSPMGGIANLESGALWFVILASVNANPPIFTAVMRVRFVG